MKQLVNFSGGLCSFWSAKRIVDELGPENVILLFADTLEEHDDLYQFNQQASAMLGVPITRLCEGIGVWDLFEKQGLIGNDRFPICSTKLKREPLNAWMESHYEMDSGQSNALFEPATVILGFDFSEYHRVVDFQSQHPTWRVRAPMTEGPLWDKCKMMSEAEKLGFKTATLYALGFPHNNCGGACVKAGISHFVHLHAVLPEKFTDWEVKELKCQQVLKERGVSNWRFTVLKDRRGGTTKPLPLRELRLRIEAGEKFPKYEWGGCGCGG